MGLHVCSERGYIYYLVDWNEAHQPTTAQKSSLQFLPHCVTPHNTYQLCAPLCSILHREGEGVTGPCILARRPAASEKGGQPGPLASLLQLLPEVWAWQIALECFFHLTDGH